MARDQARPHSQLPLWITCMRARFFCAATLPCHMALFSTTASALRSCRAAEEAPAGQCAPPCCNMQAGSCH